MGVPHTPNPTAVMSIQCTTQLSRKETWGAPSLDPSLVRVGEGEAERLIPGHAAKQHQRWVSNSRFSAGPSITPNYSLPYAKPAPPSSHNPLPLKSHQHHRAVTRDFSALLYDFLLQPTDLISSSNCCWGTRATQRVWSQ